MDRLADRPSIAGEQADAADHCLAGISRLSSEVKDASTYLPPYDQRTYAEAIKALQDKLQETRATFAPKQKFSFKSARKSPSAVSISDAAELAAQKRRNIPGYLSPNGNTPDSSLSATPGYLQTPPNERSNTNRPVPDVAPPPASSSLQQSTTTAQLSTNDDETAAGASSTTQRPSLNATSTSVSIASQTHAHIILPASTSQPNTPCTISRLTSCVLDLSRPSSQPTSTSNSFTPFASLTINHVTSSLLNCGSVNGPAHITNVQDSVLVITCRQLRMHDCHNIVVYCHVTSRPIIEDCSGVNFTTLPHSHLDELSTQTKPAAEGTQAESSPSETTPARPNLHESPNLYDQVDDFKWLKSEPSPNWSILDPAERLPEDVWREVVPGGPGRSVEDILKGVGVR